MRKSEETYNMLNIYDDFSEQRSFSHDEISSNEESPENTRLSLETSNDAIPYIGQKFATQDDAYNFYSEFAKQCGFSIRRHRTEGKDGVGRGLTRRYFVCHRAGNTPVKVSKETKPQRNRKSSRCGCQAYLRIGKNTSMGVPEWRVTGFVNNHNHELLEPNQVRFLPAYRTISDCDKNRILMFAKTGISVQQMMRLLELEKSIEPGFLPFTEKDVRNLIQTFRKVEQSDDSVDSDLLKMCKSIKEKDANFRYEFTVDDKNRLENIAWSYASSVNSYEIFGDAVVFDTTHRLNAFDMPLGIWVGLNNYGMPCFFSCVILREENVRSFSWALKVFLTFMNGRAPRTILTDQSMCLKEAISTEMPNTKHALCIWLIVVKFPSWFNAVLGERYSEWKCEFYKLYNMENVEDFEAGWRDMVDSFDLHTNRHISNLYAFRALWALPYLRSHFFAGMTIPGISKSINAFIQRFLNTQTRLARFIEQVALAVDYKDQAGIQQTMQQNLQNISLKTGAPMEAHASDILTPFAFTKLQDELVSAAHYASFQIEENCFLVRHHTEIEGGRKVIWSPHDDILSCSCNMFEFSGILCRHALRVLSTLNCFQIPDRYLPFRWRRANMIPSRLMQISSVNDHSGKVHMLQGMVTSLVCEASKSKEKLNFVFDEVSILLARIKEQPVVLGDGSVYRR